MVNLPSDPSPEDCPSPPEEPKFREPEPDEVRQVVNWAIELFLHHGRLGAVKECPNWEPVFEETYLSLFGVEIENIEESVREQLSHLPVEDWPL
jgi:hypothetical protein